MPSVTCLRLSDVTVICRVAYFQFSIQSAFLQHTGRQPAPSTGCLVSIFIVRINSKSFPWDVRSAQERYLPKFSATFDVRYCVLRPVRRTGVLLVLLRNIGHRTLPKICAAERVNTVFAP